ncbi:MAG: transglutaminase domain-containing protein [Butyrivibrio sp.]
MKNRRLISAALAAVLFSCTTFGALTGCSKRAASVSEESISEAYDPSLTVSHNTEYEYDRSTGSETGDSDSSQNMTVESTGEGFTLIETKAPSSDEGKTVPDSESVGKTEEPGKTDKTDKPTQNPGTLPDNSRTEAPSQTVSVPEETTVQEVTGPSEDTPGAPDTNFTISKITYENLNSNDFYYELVNQRGYHPVGNLDELRAFCVNSVLSLESGVKSVKYIISPAGAFDDIVGGLNTVSSVAEANPTAVNIYKKDAYLYDRLSLDYQYYYAHGIALFMMQNAGSVRLKDGSYSLYAVYYYSYETAQQVQKVKDAASSITSGFSGSTYDKLLAAYDYLKDNVSYAQNINDPVAHTSYGAFVNGSAVCEGYAKAYKIMLDNMGISNEIVVNESHAWNMALCDGEWYFIDTTNGSVNDCYMYFMLGSDVLCSSYPLRIYDWEQPGMFYVFSMDNILYYGYTSGTNTATHSLAAKSKQKIEVQQ